MQTATTIEQSRRLLELGIPVWTADMEHHMGELRIKRPEGCADDDSVKTPAWTLSALLEMLPPKCSLAITSDNGDCSLRLPADECMRGVVFYSKSGIFDSIIDALEYCILKLRDDEQV